MPRDLELYIRMPFHGEIYEDDCRRLWRVFILRKVKDATYNLIGNFGSKDWAEDIAEAERQLSSGTWSPPYDLRKEAREAQRWWFYQMDDEVEQVCLAAGYDYAAVMSKMCYLADWLNQRLPEQYKITPKEFATLI